MAMKGGALTVHLAGPDLSSLSALTGLPIVRRASFELSGQLDFADQRVQIRDLNGRLGNSDLTGNIDVEYGNGRPDAHAELASRRSIWPISALAPRQAGTAGMTRRHRGVPK